MTTIEMPHNGKKIYVPAGSGAQGQTLGHCPLRRECWQDILREVGILKAGDESIDNISMFQILYKWLRPDASQEEVEYATACTTPYEVIKERIAKRAARAAKEAAKSRGAEAWRTLPQPLLIAAAKFCAAQEKIGQTEEQIAATAGMSYIPPADRAVLLAPAAK